MSAEFGSQRDILERAGSLVEAQKYALTSLNQLSSHIHRLNRRWYADPVSGVQREFTLELAATKLALIHSEVSETLEGLRKGHPDSHLPMRSAEEVELADILIRVFDYAGWRRFDIARALAQKLAYNEIRADHKPAARTAAGGKKF